MPPTIPPPWQEVESQYRGSDVPLETWRRRYEAERQLAIARSDRPPDDESVPDFLRRRAMPFLSSVENAFEAHDYGASRDRINAGTHTASDLVTAHNYEHQQQRDSDRGVGGQIVSGLAHIPAIAGEAVIGGGVLRGLGIGAQAAPTVLRAVASPSAWGRNLAQTAVMPSMWLQPSAERAAQQGGNWYDPQNLGPAALMGFAQTAVLGSVGKLANGIAGDGIKPFLSRLAVRTFTGLGEQQALDVAGGLADQFLPEAIQTRTRFGTIGAFLNGKKGEGWAKLAEQLVTFGAFSALHPILHGEQRAETPRPEAEQPGQQTNQRPEPNQHTLENQSAAPTWDAIVKDVERRVLDLTKETGSQAKAVAAVTKEYADTNQMLREAHQQPLQGPEPGIDRLPEQNQSKVEAPTQVEQPSPQNAQPQEIAPQTNEAWLKKQPGNVVRDIAKSVSGENGKLGRSREAMERNILETDAQTRGLFLEAVRKTLDPTSLPKESAPQQPQEAAPGEQPVSSGQTVPDAGTVAKTPIPEPEAMPSASRVAPYRDVQRIAKNAGLGGKGKAAELRQKILDDGPEAKRQLRELENPQPSKERQAVPFSQKLISQELLAKGGAPDTRDFPGLDGRGQTLPGPVKAEPAAAVASRLDTTPPAPAVEAKLDTTPNVAAAKVEALMNEAKLTPYEKQVFRDRYLNGRTLEDIAAERGVKRQAVKIAEDTAKAKLAKAGYDIKASAAEFNKETGLADAEPIRQSQVAPDEIPGHVEDGAEPPKQAPPKDAQEIHWDKIEAITNRLVDTDLSPEHMKAAEAEIANLGAQPHLDTAAKIRDLVESARAKGGNVFGKVRKLVGGGTPQEIAQLIKDALDAGRHAKERGKSDVSPAEGVPGENANGPALEPDRSAQAPGTQPAGLPAEGARPGGNAADAISSSPSGRIIRGPGQKPGREGAINFGALFGRAAPEAKQAVENAEKITKETTESPEPKVAVSTAERYRNGVNYLHDEIGRLGGKMFTTTTRLARTVGEHLTRAVVVNTYAHAAAPEMIDRVLGPKITDEQNLLNAAVLHEMRFRRYKDYLLEEAAKIKPKDFNEGAKLEAMAQAVKTFVGQEGSPLTTEADYLNGQKNPEVKQFLDNWERDMVPLQEANFRGAMDMEADDPINSPSQIPTHPFNAIAVRRGDPGSENAVFFNSSRGNLKNTRIGSTGFEKQASLAADGYVLDMKRIIENTIARGSSVARKAELFKHTIEEGHGVRGEPGQKDVKLEDGSATREFPNVYKGKESSFYVNEKMYDEFRSGLAVDRPFHYPMFKALTDGLNKLTLASTVEVLYHGKNMMTMFMKPGMLNLPNLIKNAVGFSKNNPEVMARVVEMARIGAAKPPGQHEGFLWGGKTDPTSWGGKFLDGLDAIVRLQAMDAFDRNVKMGAKDTETNRRNFVNQTGQYEIKAQSKIIAWLRDSGIGPFATAGSNYYVQGIKSLIGGHGMETNSVGSDLAFRASMIGKTAAVMGAVAFANYKLWGSIFGDDNTPLGAIKTGSTEDGKTTYFDLVSLTGFTRGMRQTGLLALSEGVRSGSEPGKIADRAMDSFYTNLLHSAAGPGVSFAHTLVTGKNMLGRDIARKPAPSGSQALENLRAAAFQANPIVSAMTGAENPSQGTTLGIDTESPLWERGAKLLGPFNPVKVKGGREAMVNQVYERMKGLQDARTLHLRDADTARTPFPQAGELHTLTRFASAISQLEHAIKGDRRAGRSPYMASTPPSPEVVRSLRERQASLARQALEFSRRVRERQPSGRP